MTKKQRIHLRAERRQNKLCLDCGHNELGTTACGDTSKYCDRCLPSHATGKPRKPVIVRPSHLELGEDGHPLPFNETKAGKAFAIAFLRAVKVLTTKDDPRVTLSQIKEYMGEDYNERNSINTANDLEASGLLEYRQKGSRMAWVSAEPRVEKPRHFIDPGEHRAKSKIHIGPPTDRTRPSVESFERAREVGA